MADTAPAVTGPGTHQRPQWDELPARRRDLFAMTVRALVSDLFHGRGNRSMRRGLGAHADDRDRLVTALRRLHPERPVDADAQAAVTADPRLMTAVADDVPIDDGPIAERVLELLWALGPDLDIELWPVIAVEDDLDRVLTEWSQLLDLVELADDVDAGPDPPPHPPTSPRVLACQLVTAPGAPQRLASAST